MTVRALSRIPMVAALAALAVLAAGSTAASAAVYFHSPSGNIGCGLSTRGARCDIGDHSWKAPPKPGACKFDWGYGLTVGKHGDGSFFCGSDTVLHLGSRLGYGKSIRRGRFKCVSRTDGMRCVNVRNKHGFKLSIEHASRF